ncbi:uncharacterized protein [Nicotiana sylvestris]|uniref:uncharacterized protein n=1 Tax=Nicotiana sylvestris TaxID=4096 RepID=UPI00388CE1EC
MSSSCGSTGKTKDPMNCYFLQKSGDKGGKSGNPQIDAKAILRDRAVIMFARWMYDACLPFNCVNYTDTFVAFIEVVGQYGPGMKPPTYYEVRGPYLKKEMAEVNKIVEEHKVEWNKFGYSIMMDKWTARNGKIIINILVNSPKRSLFLESVDASDSSTDLTKMYSLFKSTIDSIGAENIVQVVMDNANESVKAGGLMSVGYPHIYWTPRATHSINLIFGDIFKERPFSTVFNQKRGSPGSVCFGAAVDIMMKVLVLAVYSLMDISMVEKVKNRWEGESESIHYSNTIGYLRKLLQFLQGEPTISSRGPDDLVLQVAIEKDWDLSYQMDHVRWGTLIECLKIPPAIVPKIGD